MCSFLSSCCSWGGSGVQGCRGAGVQGHRQFVASGVQGYRGTGVQGYRGTGVQACRGTGLQSVQDYNYTLLVKAFIQALKGFERASFKRVP